MQGISKRFGGFSYEEEEVITFEKGLCGFPDRTRFVIRRPKATAPFCWLLSVEEPLDIPIVRPDKLFPEYAITILPVADVTTALGCEKKSQARIYCLASLPKDLTKSSINLRAPLIINPKTRVGVQYCQPGIKKLPIRQPIYRELTGSKSSGQGMLVILRSQNEKINIGDDIVIEILETLPGGAVRVGVSAPKELKVSRGEGTISPETETLRAASLDFSMKELVGLTKKSGAAS